MNQTFARWMAFALLLGITGVAAGVGSRASLGAKEFYNRLSRPPFAPPPGVFAPVWAVLYVLMAIAAWMMVRTLDWPAATSLIVLYVVQLAVNALWTWCFFRWHSGAGAFINILVLAALIVGMIVKFWQVQALAGLLLLPYLGWVTFATALTWATWRRNPRILG